MAAKTVIFLNLCILTKVAVADEMKSDNTTVQHFSAVFIRLVLLMLVLIASIIENFILLMLTLGPMNQWFRIRKEHKHFTNSSILSRRQSEICFYQARDAKIKRVTSMHNGDNNSSESSQRIISCNRCHHNHSDPFTTINCSTGRFTRYYFGNLCFANLLLAILAMPSTLLACLGLSGSKELNSDNTSTISEIKPVNAHPSHALLNETNISYVYCTLIEFSVAALAMAMIMCLVQLTADRLLAVCKPFHYLRFMTRRRALMNIVAGWVISILMALAPHGWLILTQQEHEEEPVKMSDVFQCFILGQHADGGHRYYVYAYFCIAYILPIVFMFSAYGKMYATAKRLSANCHASLPQPQISLGTFTGQAVPNENGIPQQNNKNGPLVSSFLTKFIKRKNKLTEAAKEDGNVKQNSSRAGEMRAAMRAFWLVATILSLTLPYFCIMLRSAIKSEIYESQAGFFDENEAGEVKDRPMVVHKTADKTYEQNLNDNQKDIEEVIRSVCVWLLYVNSTLTPGIYTYMDRVLRTRFLSVFSSPKNTFKRNRNGPCEICKQNQKKKILEDTDDICKESQTDNSDVGILVK